MYAHVQRTNVRAIDPFQILMFHSIRIRNLKRVASRMHISVRFPRFRADILITISALYGNFVSHEKKKIHRKFVSFLVFRFRFSLFFFIFIFFFFASIKFGNCDNNLTAGSINNANVSNARLQLGNR